MVRCARWAALLGLGLAGCLPAADLALPWPEGARSALVRAPEHPARLYALEPSAGASAWPADAPLEVLFFDVPLERLQLRAGPIDASRGARPVPALRAAVRGRRAGAAFEWTAWTPGASELQPFLLPELDVEACIADFGCVAADGLRCGACAPAAIDPPAEVEIECPWSDAAPADCRPAVVTPADCPVGARARWDAPECAPLLECPADPDGYREALPSGELVFVRPGASAGLGTREAPYGSLAEALAAEGPRGTWVLGPGDFAEGLRLGAQDDLTLIGACPTRTRLVPPVGPAVAIAGGGLRLDGVGLVATSSSALIAVDARVALSHVDATSGGAVTAVVQRGEVRLDASVLRGVGLGLYQQGGRVVMRDSEARGEEGFHCESQGDLRMERTTLVGRGVVGRGGGVRAFGCPGATLLGVRLGGFGVVGIKIVPADGVRLEDVAVGSGTQDGIELGDRTPPPVGTASNALEAVYVEGCSRVGLKNTGGDFLLRRIFVHDTSRAGIEIFSLEGAQAVATLEEIFVRDAGEGAVEIGSERAAPERSWATVSDLRCELSSVAQVIRQVCLSVRDRATLQLSRLAAGPGVYSGLFARDATVDGADLRVEAPEGPGIDVLGVEHMDLARVAVAAPKTVGVQVRSGEEPVRLAHLEVRGGDIGLGIDTATRVDIAPLRIVGAGVGIVLEQAPQTTLQGLARATSIGVRYRDPDDLQRVLPGLRIEAPTLLDAEP